MRTNRLLVVLFLATSWGCGTGGGGGTGGGTGTAGGATAGGATAGGSTAGGGTAGGATAGGATAGGATAGGATAGGSTAGGAAGGSAATPAALYPLNGEYWNDYVRATGATVLDATDTACDPMTDGGPSACLHAGEVRAIDITGQATCTNLTITDALAAFDWICVAGGQGARGVSTRLKPAKRLADLIDFTVPGWRSNSISVSNGVSTVFTSTPAVWWRNAVRRDSDGIAMGQSTPREIVVTRAGDLGTYYLDRDKVGFVVEPGAAIGRTSGTGLAVVNAGNAAFLWVEGNVNGGTSATGLAATNLAFSRVRNVFVDGGTGPGVTLTVRSSVVENLATMNARGISVTGSTDSVMNNLSDNSPWGVGFMSTARLSVSNVSTRGGGNFRVDISDRDVFDRISVVGSSGTSVDVLNGTFSRVSNVTAVNSGGEAIRFSGTFARGCTVSHARVAGVAAGFNAVNFAIVESLFYDAVVFGGSINVFMGPGSNRFINVLSSAGTFGFRPSASAGGKHVLLNATAVNNEDIGFDLGGQPLTLGNLLAANNQSGVVFNGTGMGSVAHNTVSSDNEARGVAVLGPTDSVTFTGVFKATNNTTANCFRSAMQPGLDNLCTMTGASTALVSAGPLNASFIGPAASDTANPSDTNGTALFTAITDFASFDSRERGWGRDGMAVFPGAAIQGACRSGATCRIWDFGLRMSDASARGVAGVPSGNDTFVHAWGTAATSQADCNLITAGSVFGGGLCTSTFLRNAIELLDDGAGNENGLCESNETCVVSPNAGAYQGHGPLVSAGAFSGGTITGVTLMRHTTNGY